MKNIKILISSHIIKLLIVGSVFFFVAFYSGYLYSQASFTRYLHSFKLQRTGLAEFSLINPLIGVDSPSVFNIGLFSNTKDKIEGLIKDSQPDGLIIAGVYYRDLNSSAWFGLNEDEEFVPASLLKMTYALAAFKQSESESSFLDKNLIYTQDLADETRKRNNAEDKTELVVGQSYTVHDLIKIMLSKSDNGARDALQSVIDKKYVDSVFSYLGIVAPDAVNNFQISTKNYALFFRMLYGSIFINEEHSQDLLSMLTKTEFAYGLTQSIPSSIAIAHKWGVYNFPKEADGTAAQELHDCGIIYEPGHPYLLCVMTKGTNQEVLAKFIAEISKIIYKDTVTDRSFSE